MRVYLAVLLSALMIGGCGSNPPASSTPPVASFEELNSQFRGLDAGKDPDFGTLEVVTLNLWTKYPSRREEWIKPWLTDAKGDIHKKNLILTYLVGAKWDKDIDATERPKLEEVLKQSISVERSNLIQDYCQIARNGRLKSLAPALKSAGADMKDGTNKKAIDDTVVFLEAGH
ncbi:MAG: hypothetical protein GC165_14005 [Armatimonadetes bacterium]|nr:hypothetical protein [Armatimonadota bacterium]